MGNCSHLARLVRVLDWVWTRHKLGPALFAENVLDYAQALIRFTSKAAGILSALSLR